MVRARAVLQRGVTFVEIIVALLVLAALAVTVVPKISIDVYTVESQAQRLASDLRRAQLLATHSAASVCVALIGSGGYAVYRYDVSAGCLSVSGQELNDPATGQKFIVTLSSNATIARTAGSMPLVFNSWGLPTSGSVTLTLSGQVNVNVTQSTGFVSVVPI